MIKDLFLTTLTSHYPLMTGIIAVLSSQIIKSFLFVFKNKSLNKKNMFQAGGMPSSHSCMVIGLSTAVLIQEGSQSATFAVCMIFSFVVLYDATGVRQAVGKQAVLLNQLVDDFFKGRLKPEKFSELLGHTPLEVIVGSILGVAIAIGLKSLI